MGLPTPKEIDENLKVIRRFLGWLLPGFPRGLLSRLTIILVFTILSGVLIGYLMSPWLDSLLRQSPKVNLPNQPQVQGLGSDGQRSEVQQGENADGEYSNFESKDWDTSWFYKDSDGFYCPLQRSSFSYYFIWLEQPSPFLGRFGFKLKTRPINPEFITTPGEIVLTQKQSEDGLFEFYFPVRNELKVKHRYGVSDEEGNKNLKWSEGRSIFALVMPSTVVELEYENKLLVANTVSGVFSVLFIPKGLDDQTRVQKDFSYQYFISDRPSPEDLGGFIGLGVDKNSCLMIEKVLK